MAEAWPAAALAVVWGGLLIGIALGAITQATRFCTMGAIADWVSFGGAGRLLMWGLALAVAAFGSLALIGLGWLDGERTLPWSARFLWLSYLAGGTVFGCGMVLASGCPQRNLVRLGGGNLKALVTLLVAAVASEMTLRGIIAVGRVAWLDRWGVDLGHAQDLGSFVGGWTGASPAPLRWALLALAAALLALALWRRRAELDAPHWIGGIGIGLLVPTAWFVTGHLGYLAEDPRTLEAAWLGTYSHRPEALSFAAPLAYSLDLLTLWSDRENRVTFGVTVVLGVVLGSAAAALWRREFRVESFRDAADVGRHLVGGVLMGAGGVTAMGCSIGQGLSGVAMLSAGSCLALAGIAGGAWAMLRWEQRRIESAA